jgi:hypothetical protein
VKTTYVKLKVPPELIADYERERIGGVQFEPNELEEEPTDYDPVREADWITYEDVLNHETVDELRQSVAFQLRQERGTRMLYVVEVSEDGAKVRTYASDGSSGVQAGERVI